MIVLKEINAEDLKVCDKLLAPYKGIIGLREVISNETEDGINRDILLTNLDDEQNRVLLHKYDSIIIVKEID